MVTLLKTGRPRKKIVVKPVIAFQPFAALGSKVGFSGSAHATPRALSNTVGKTTRQESGPVLVATTGFPSSVTVRVVEFCSVKTTVLARIDWVTSAAATADRKSTRLNSSNSSI